MAKRSAHGTEIARYFVNGTLRSVRRGGTVLPMSAVNCTWTLRDRKKAQLTLAEWTELKLAAVARLIDSSVVHGSEVRYGG